MNHYLDKLVPLSSGYRRAFVVESDASILKLWWEVGYGLRVERLGAEASALLLPPSRKQNLLTEM